MNLFTVERQTSSPVSSTPSPVVSDQARIPTEKPNVVTVRTINPELNFRVNLSSFVDIIFAGTNQVGQSNNAANATEQFWSVSIYIITHCHLVLILPSKYIFVQKHTECHKDRSCRHIHRLQMLYYHIPLVSSAGCRHSSDCIIIFSSIHQNSVNV